MWSARSSTETHESARLLQDPNNYGRRSAGPTRGEKFSATANESVPSDEPTRPTGKDILASCVITPFSFGSGWFGAISILLTTMSVSFLIFSTVDTSDMTSAVSNSISISVMILSIVVVILFHVFRSKIRLNDGRRIRHNNVTYVIRKNVILITITVFYFLSVVLDMYHVIAEFSCSEVWISCGEVVKRIYQTKVGFHLTRLIFVSAEMIFCWFFRHVKFRHGCAVNYGLVVIIAANCSLWFDSLLEEFDESNSNKTRNERTEFCNETGNRTKSASDCYNNTEYIQLQNTINPLFYPITIEYSLLVVEWLFEKFLYLGPSQGRDSNIERNRDNHPGISAHGVESGSEREDFITVETSPNPSQANNRRCPTIQIVYAAQVLMFILYVIFNALKRSDNSMAYINIYLAFKTVFTLAQIFAILFGFAVGKSFGPTSDMPTVKHFDGFKTFVVFSSLGVFIQKFSRIAETFSSELELHSGAPGLGLTSNFISVLGIVYQIQFLIYCQMIAKKKGSRFCRKTFDAVLSFLAICNFGSWLVKSFMLTHKEAETYLYKLLTPFTLYFRFNSMIVFLKAYLKDNSHARNY